MRIHPNHFTFTVDKVTPAAVAISEWTSYDAARYLLRSEIESCSDFHSTVVPSLFHGLLHAVFVAYSEHRPLVLSPDIIWITILQGLSHHLALHPESIPQNVIRDTGRSTLKLRLDNFIKGSPDNPWAEAFADWSEQIRQHIGPELHDAMICNFTTSGQIDIAVSQLVMMDAFDRFFHYEAVSVCGIPSLTLEGSPEDWEKLRAKIEVLRPFGVDWWLEHLRAICSEFCEAAYGRVNLEHWQNICKLKAGYNVRVINGWIAKLFPYIRDPVSGLTRTKNPIFASGDGFESLFAPTGLNVIPFIWKISQPGRLQTEYEMDAIGGFIGIEQDAATFSLRPKVGWAIREVTGLTAIHHRLERVTNEQPSDLFLSQSPEIIRTVSEGALLGNGPERSLAVEVASHLYDKERLSLGQAAKLAGLDRLLLEDELYKRKIPAYRYDAQDLEDDMRRPSAQTGQEK